MPPKYKIGDLVRLHDSNDSDRQIGVIIDENPRPAHLATHGTTRIYQVYWPTINESDWEYDFFLAKLDDKDLTKEKK